MIYFDLETTGLDILKDRIVEIYALKTENDKTIELHYVVNPGIPIPKEASEINGFTDESIKDKLPLSNYIKEIFDFFGGQDIVGYNILNYDLLLLTEEFSRHGIIFDISNIKVIDLFTLWHNLESKNLKGALKRFCNEEMENLHSARNDVNATLKVHRKMLETFGISHLAIEDLSNLSAPSNTGLCFGKLQFNESGDMIFNFGKYKDLSIKEVYDKDIEYLRWIYKESKDYCMKYFVTKEAIKIKSEKEKLR